MACTLSRFTARRTTRHRTSAWPGSWCHVKSTRLTESPACLVTEASGITPALARMYRASGQAVPVGKRILELNPKHPLVTATGAQEPRRRFLTGRTAELLRAQPFSPKATYPRTRRSSPDCSRSVWPAPYRRRQRSLSRPAQIARSARRWPARVSNPSSLSATAAATYPLAAPQSMCPSPAVMPHAKCRPTVQHEDPARPHARHAEAGQRTCGSAGWSSPSGLD
jgi:hypothetical protein